MLDSELFFGAIVNLDALAGYSKFVELGILVFGFRLYFKHNRNWL